MNITLKKINLIPLSHSNDRAQMKTYLLIQNKRHYINYGAFFLCIGKECAEKKATEGYRIIFDFESQDFNLHTSIWSKYENACLSGWAHLTRRHQNETYIQLQERHKIVQAMIEQQFKEHLESIPDDNG